ncbi:MAG: 50S ribosomal protein L15 [Candidatus Omnitrophica bacterium]|nr:50S ribosomal protein L15 [Candidatus Omnitrophota bacterium]
MLKLNDLKSPKGARKSKKVVGRGSGSGHGKTSGRGHKGQLSRTGKGKRPGFEGGQMPLIRRIPKRGFISKFKKVYQLVNLASLNKCKDKTTVTPKVLKALGLINKLHVSVKILGQGKLEKSITVKAHKFSKTAIQAIEGLGGKVEILRPATKQDRND